MGSITRNGLIVKYLTEKFSEKKKRKLVRVFSFAVILLYFRQLSSVASITVTS